MKDIRDVTVHTDLPKEERITDFVKQIKNPYRFLYKDTIINISFTETEQNIETVLKQYFKAIK